MAELEATPFFPVPPTSCAVVPIGEKPPNLEGRLLTLREVAANLRRVAPRAVYDLFCEPFQVHVLGTSEEVQAILEHLTDHPDRGGLYFPHPS